MLSIEPNLKKTCIPAEHLGLFTNEPAENLCLFTYFLSGLQQSNHDILQKDNLKGLQREKERHIHLAIKYIPILTKMAVMLCITLSAFAKF